MISFDIDIETQKIFNKLYSNLPIVKWPNWLDISSKEEYLDYVLKHSGLYDVDELFKKIKEETNHQQKEESDN